MTDDHLYPAGTPVYMAPELMSNDRNIEGRPELVDVYSFGVLIFAVLAREKPYEMLVRTKRMNLWTLRSAIADDNTRPDGEHAKEKLDEAPQGVVELIRRCWAADPDERPSNFDEIIEELKRSSSRGQGAGVGAVESTANPMLGAPQELALVANERQEL